MATMPGLRPLAVGEILDAGVKLAWRHWRVLATCVVGFVLPLQIASSAVVLAFVPEQLDPSTSEPVRLASTDDPELLAAEISIAAIQGLTYLLMVGACFKAVADARLGATPSARDSIAFLLPRLPAVLGVFVLYAVGVALGTFALFVPGLWLAVSWSLAIPALLFERAGPSAALGRSFRLVQGRWWGTFGALLVGVLLVGLVGAFVESVLVAPVLSADVTDATAAVATVVGGTIGGALTAPFSAAIVAFLYVDQRVRKEGFDARSLAEGVGEKTETGAEPTGAPREAGAEPAGAPPEIEPEPAGAPDDETRWLPPRPPSATA